MKRKERLFSGRFFAATLRRGFFRLRTGHHVIEAVEDLLYLLMLKFMATAFTHCLFNLLWYDSNAPKRWLNLLKSNAANERGG